MARTALIECGPRHERRFSYGEMDSGARGVARALLRRGFARGDRIAIMRDGRVVQIGTAEDNVMHPADDYVADFVAGISRLKVVKAHAVMQPVAEFERDNGPIPADVLRVAEDENLSTLITLAIDQHGPIVIAEDGRDIGVVTRRDILRTVIEGTEVS